MSPETAPAELHHSQSHDAATLASGAGITLVGRIAGRVVHLAVQVVMARLLGAEAFGLYAIGWTAVRVGGLVAPLGLDQGMLRYGSLHWDLDRNTLRNLLRRALAVALSAGVIIGAVLYVAAAPIAETLFDKPDLTPVLRWFAPALALMAGLRVAAAASRLSRSMKWSVYAEDLGRPASNLILLLVLYVAGGGLLAAVAATVASFAVAFALALSYLRRLLPAGLSTPRAAPTPVRALLTFSVPVSLSGVCTALIMWIDVLMVGYFLSATEVGIYQAASQVSMLFTFVASAFAAIFAPMIADLHQRGEMTRLEELFRLSTKWTLYLTIPLYLVIGTARTEIMTVVFGEDFAPGAVPLAILATGQMVNVAMGTVGLLLVMTGWYMRWLLFSVLMLVMSVVLNALLIPRFGLPGAAVSTAISVSALFILGLLHTRRVLGIWPYDRRSAKLVAPAVCVGIAAIVVRIVGIHSALANLLLLSMSSLGIFAAGFVLFGLDREDRDFLARVGSFVRRSTVAPAERVEAGLDSQNGWATQSRGVPHGAASENGRPMFRVLGVCVDAVQIPDVARTIDGWVRDRHRCRIITVTSMHGVMESQDDASFKQILNSADLTVPDGMPLIWLSRRQGFALKRRVYGPELLQVICCETGKQYRHFFLGAAEDVAERLAQRFREQHQVSVVGTYSPPFRPLTPSEDADLVARINRAAPDVLWVGLGTPKQERWMWQHRHALRVPVVVGVGAAFDFLTGVTPWAPRWMRENGLEWLFRLVSEPRRLWRRYLIAGSRFLGNLVLEHMRLKRFD